MSVILTIIMSVIGTAMLGNVLDKERFHNDVIFRRAELVPITKSVLQNYTVAGTTEIFITKTVENIYSAVVREAANGKSGYLGEFHPLRPVHVYPLQTYLPVIIERLTTLFPDSQVEINLHSAMVGVFWY